MIRPIQNFALQFSDKVKSGINKKMTVTFLNFATSYFIIQDQICNIKYNYIVLIFLKFETREVPNFPSYEVWNLVLVNSIPNFAFWNTEFEKKQNITNVTSAEFLFKENIRSVYVIRRGVLIQYLRDTIKKSYKYIF